MNAIESLVISMARDTLVDWGRVTSALIGQFCSGNSTLQDLDDALAHICISMGQYADVTLETTTEAPQRTPFILALEDIWETTCKIRDNAENALLLVRAAKCDRS